MSCRRSLAFHSSVLCLPLAYLLFKFNLHYLKNLKSENSSCVMRQGLAQALALALGAFPSFPFGFFRAAFLLEHFYLLAAVPGNFCLFSASFYGQPRNARYSLIFYALPYLKLLSARRLNSLQLC